MAILYRLQKGKSTTPEELVSTLGAGGLTIAQSTISVRRDGGYVYDVLGVIDRGVLQYDIMFRNQNNPLTNAYNSDLIDLVRAAKMDGFLKFTETGCDIAPGVIPLSAELGVEANIYFLRTIAKRLKKNHPHMSRVNLACFLNDRNNYLFESV
ncbi:hypothetical protein HYU21_01105 [Candidatus Woesearchaeota archaeon]|nr:hypothetical protein [Candidatus Woesearchaeota archaeon]